MLRVEQGIITPRLTGWLVNNSEAHWADEEVAKQLLPIMTTEYERKKGIHPSQIHTCMRAQMLEYLGAPAERKISTGTAMIFMDGKFRHLRWQTMLLMAGIVNQIEVPLEIPEARFVGSMDGRGDDWLFELKGVGWGWKPDMKPYDQHIDQIHAYFWACNELGNGITRASLIYEDKKTSATWQEFVIQPEASRLRHVDLRIKNLNKCIDKGVLPDVQPECAKAAGQAPSKQCAEYRNCPYSSICLSLKGPEDIEAARNGGKRRIKVKRPKKRTR